MMKKLLRPHTGDSAAIQASSHMFAASCGEVVSILVILTRDQNFYFSLTKLQTGTFLDMIDIFKTSDWTLNSLLHVGRVFGSSAMWSCKATCSGITSPHNVARPEDFLEIWGRYIHSYWKKVSLNHACDFRYTLVPAYSEFSYNQSPAVTSIIFLKKKVIEIMFKKLQQNNASSAPFQGIVGMYRGYFSTVMREIPFSLLQFPLWEYLKVFVNSNNNIPILFNLESSHVV